jgi:acetoin utilization protein AcuB
MSVPTVEHYMSRIPYTIQRDATLSEAHKLMRKFQIHHLPVMEGEELVGLVSTRDLHLLESLKDVDPDDVPVEDAMSEKPYTVPETESLLSVAAHMANKRIGSAVVVRKGEVVGVFTTHDALLALVHRWKAEGDQ